MLPCAATLSTVLGLPTPALAQSSSLFDQGRLLATGGVTNIEGAGGGGISTWAPITGYGTKDGVGANVHGTYTRLSNYSVANTGAGIGLFDRVELTYNRLMFDTGSTGGKLGLGRGFTFSQDVVGAKVRLFGNIVYDQGLLPEVSAGLQYKTTDHANILKAIGAKSNEGVDYYLAASKLFLDYSILANGTLRLTKANQIGILGFGGNKHNDYQPQFEGSLAYLFSKDFVVGGEYRTKASNLAFTKEDDWKTLYAAYFFNKNASLTLAYVNLGTIATIKNQQGVYLSAQIGF
jgi:hypothetical protein